MSVATGIQVFFFIVFAAFTCANGYTNASGFGLLFTTSPDEYEDYPLTFKHPLPKWLHGDWIRNGGGKFEMGSRHFSHAFDAYAKLTKFSFKGDGKTVTYTTKFLQSAFYRKSKAKNDIAPYIILEQPAPPFDFFQKMKQFSNGFDNINVNIFKYGADYVAIADTWNLYTFNVTDLSTLVNDSILPGISGLPTSKTFRGALSAGHPVRLPGTEYYVDHALELDLRSSTINVALIKSATERQLITRFNVDRNYYVHSFALTENYVVYFLHPCYVDILATLLRANSIDGLKWDSSSGTNVYVVHIKSGKVRHLTTEPRFFMHLANSYELRNNKNDSEEPTIVADFVTYENSSLMTHFSLDHMKKHFKHNPPTQLNRYYVHLNNGTITPVLLKDEQLTFDFPIINEKYRFREYCFLYGMHYLVNGTTAVVKKDLCSLTEELAWYVPNHFPSEPWFVPNPDGSSEDDGIVLSVVLDGDRRKSYVAVLDATTMRLINYAYLPNIVPFSLHGRIFD